MLAVGNWSFLISNVVCQVQIHRLDNGPEKCPFWRLSSFDFLVQEASRTIKVCGSKCAWHHAYTEPHECCHQFLKNVRLSVSVNCRVECELHMHILRVGWYVLRSHKCQVICSRVQLWWGCAHDLYHAGHARQKNHFNHIANYFFEKFEKNNFCFSWVSLLNWILKIDIISKLRSYFCNCARVCFGCFLWQKNNFLKKKHECHCNLITDSRVLN